MERVLALVERAINRTDSFYWTGLVAGFAWWGGSQTDDPWGGAVTIGIVYALDGAWRLYSSHREAKKVRPMIGTISQRPVLEDYRRVLIVPAGDEGAPYAAMAFADLVITPHDLVIKDRYHEKGDLIHPGLYNAVKLLPGSKVLDLTNDFVRNRVVKEIKEKAGRADLWGFPLEVVHEGRGFDRE